MNNSEIKHLKCNGIEYPFIYSLNVMSAIQKRYGSLDNWANKIEPKNGKKEPNIDALLFFFTEAINEGIDMENEKLQTPRPLVDVKKVGRIISEIGLEEAGKQLKGELLMQVLKLIIRLGIMNPQKTNRPHRTIQD